MNNLSKIYKLVQNSNLRGFCFLLLISRVGFTFFFKIEKLILADKGFNKDILANFILISIFVELIFNIFVTKPIDNYLTYGMKYYKYYVLSHVLTLIYLYYYDDYKSNETLTIVVLVLINILSGFTRSYFNLGFYGFYNKISDRDIGGTYLTALNSVNNLSMSLPGIIVYPAIDYFGYLAVGTASIVYSFFFMFVLGNKLAKYDSIEKEKWKAKLD